MKLTITYTAGGHSAVESDLYDLLATVREEFPNAVAYTRNGDDVETNEGLTPGIDVLIWEDEESAADDEGRRAIAKVTVEE